MGAAIAIVATVPIASKGAGSPAATGTLAFRAVFRIKSQAVTCPAGTPRAIECFSREGRGVVPGLGSVTESYLYPVTPNDEAPEEGNLGGCKVGLYRVLSYPVRFTVAGKGTIGVVVPASTECVQVESVLNPTYPPFTIIGGSDRYAGASGGGTLTHAVGFTSSGAVGSDTFVGTLVVSGLAFDLTPPSLRGATGKTVRAPKGAKRVRVTYNVSAQDEVDGVVPVSCQPKSGSRFKIGRTVVMCSTTDMSGNAQSAKFRVTVKAGR